MIFCSSFFIPVKFHTLNYYITRKRKREEEPPLKRRRVDVRQTFRDSKQVRESAVSTESVHLASAQIFREQCCLDAYHVVLALAADPERNGPYLREALKSIDKKKNPQIPQERVLSTFFRRQISGML